MATRQAGFSPQYSGLFTMLTVAAGENARTSRGLPYSTVTDFARLRG